MASSESQATRGPIVYGQIVNSQTGIPEIQEKVSERMKRRIKRKEERGATTSVDEDEIDVIDTR